jgi:DNA-binding CsgD family transcriptional regulator
MNIERLSALIDTFYAASVAPEGWPEAATRTARFFASESTVISMRVADFGNILWRAATTNYDRGVQQEYTAYFYRLDPFADRWNAIGRPDIFAGHELVDPEVFRKSEFYNDYCRRVGAFHCLGAGVELDFDRKLILGIHRPMGCKDFGAEDRRSLELLLPHLSRAAQVHVLLATADLQRRLANGMFDALSVSAIIVDRGCKLVFANDLANRLLRAGDGLRVQQGQLTTRDSRQDAALQEAVCRASVIACGGAAPAGDVLLVRRTNRRPLSVLVVPLPRDAWIGGLVDAPAIVFASDPEARPLPATTALATLYQLTRAEARLLAALLQGERIAEFAERIGISINTANTQLKQIFAKTGTNRQSDLMRQMFSDPIASLVNPKG